MKSAGSWIACSKMRFTMLNAPTRNAPEDKNRTRKNFTGSFSDCSLEKYFMIEKLAASTRLTGLTNHRKSSPKFQNTTKSRKIIFGAGKHSLPPPHNSGIDLVFKISP